MKKINMLLKNKYKLERKIAQGGMSSIYLCTNIELGNKWIVKHVDKKYSDFVYEEDILKKLNHICLPKIIDICKDESGIYIIESYIEGISLQKKLDLFGELKLDKVIDYMLQLCEVLIYLHNIKPKGIIHKDLKPSNIIITEYDKLVLIDFGIAEEQDSIRSSIRAGTNSYASPEQLVSSKSSDGRGDIFSLGIVLHQMLTGELPGRCEKAEGDRGSYVYRKLLEISEKCSRFLPEDRYQKVEEIKKDLLVIRNKYILIKENNKLKKKVILSLIVSISIINYICLVIGLIFFKG
jgi:serine/threonine protein kinase